MEFDKFGFPERCQMLDKHKAICSILVQIEDSHGSLPEGKLFEEVGKHTMTMVGDVIAYAERLVADDDFWKSLADQLKPSETKQHIFRLVVPMMVQRGIVDQERADVALANLLGGVSKYKLREELRSAIEAAR